MPVKTEAEREERAEALVTSNTREKIQEAEARGRREQLVDSRLDHHQERLEAINGSVARSAKAIESLGEKVDRLGAKIDQTEAVNIALAKAAEKAISASISRKDFIVGLALVIVMFLGTIATVLIAALG